VALVFGTAGLLAGCGSSGGSSGGSTSSSTAKATRQSAAPRRSVPVPLAVARQLGPLPDGRSGIAVAGFGGEVYVSGGLSPAGVSTDTIFKLAPSGAATPAGTLPEAIHDAASAAIGNRLLVFGGGPSEGSDHVLEISPGPPRQIGTLPQALSDLVAVPFGTSAYVLGGWNGSNTNADIYRASASGSVATVGSIPLGVRYPAAGALDGRLVIAGGETAASTPTRDVWSFDPATGRTTPLPPLPVPTDHAAGAVLNGRFYLLGGLREGVFTDAILSWAPGQSRWRDAGRLPAAVSDLAAVPFDGGIAAVGGRGSSGQTAAVTLLRPR
jgi:hypothetical protein